MMAPMHPLALPWLLALPAARAEAPFAVVDAIEVREGASRWRRARRTSRAWWQLPEGEPVPLQQGGAIPRGAWVVTEGARVAIRLSEGGRLTVEPDSLVQLDQPGVFQELGRILYEVRRSFAVETDTVEAVVEGTRFYVQAGPTQAVAVLRGRVRVRAGSNEVVLGRGQVVRLEEGGLGPPRRLGGEDRRAMLRAGRSLWVPSLELGVSAGGRVDGAGAIPLATVDARLRLGTHLLLAANLGAGGVAGTLHLPLNVGLEGALGPIRAGVGPATAIEATEGPCASRVLLHIGVQGTLSASLPAGLAGLRLHPTLHLLWLDGPSADLALGVSWAL